MDTVDFRYEDTGCPPSLKTHLGKSAPERITALGNLEILRRKSMALFCSVKCPGNLILQTYDLAQNLRQTGVATIGGFHSPMERECLTILLRGVQPIIICPARGIKGMRIKAEYRKPLEEGRLLFLSCFDEKQRRPTVQTSLFRNRFVAALAEMIFVAYAEPHGKTEQFCSEIMAWGKPVYTLASKFNKNLLDMGAQSVEPDKISEWERTNKK
jgi:predicted Rossmann fold nucleotide-binding protein DprA/Smf involved in DNA uptake